MEIKLNSIGEEAKVCREAFVNFPVDGYTLHCHHDLIGETLQCSAENRINFILTAKPIHEQALRLRLFRPVSKEKMLLKKASADYRKAYADWQKADADRQKADADWQKAYADWQKVYADRRKADWQKAYAAYRKADTDRQKVYADRRKAGVDLGNIIHKKFCVKNCPWNGKTIFSD